MTAAGSKKDDAANKTDAEDAKHDDAPDPVVETQVTFDGIRAVDTIDGVTQEPREATFAEQIAMHAPDLLSQVVKTVPWAVSGDVDVSEHTLTITLYR